VLVQVTGYARACNLTLIHPDVKPVSARDLPKSSHGLLGKQSNLCNLFVSSCVIGVNVTVWADQQVTCVVREEIEQDEASLPTEDDQCVLVGLARTKTEWAFIVRWLLPGLQVDQTMRSPEPLKVVLQRGH
jgi:hypothetical protein